jgi:hypothetical protein
MRKKTVLLFLLLAIFLLLTPGRLYAQSMGNPPSWNCLDMKVKNPKLHLVSVFTKPSAPLSPLAPAYVVECYNKEDNFDNLQDLYCTTGDTDADSLFGLKGPPPSWQINTRPNQPVPITADGRLQGEPIDWASKGPYQWHKFWAVQQLPPSTDINQTANDPSLKLSSWSPQVQNGDADCVSIRWDPKGIVFDSKSLEPVDGLDVYLYYDNNVLVPLTQINEGFNPAEKKFNAEFNFTVASQDYLMDVKTTNHKFPSTVNPLPFLTDPEFPYLKNTDPIVYDKEFYYGGKFHEPQKEVVLNVPIDPVGTAYKRNVQLKNHCELNKKKSRYVCNGVTSHPYSIVTFNDGQKVKTDAFGAYTNVKIDAQKLGKNGVKATASKSPFFAKVQASLVNTDRIAKIRDIFAGFLSVYAQTDEATITSEPILNYLEGYIINPQTKQPVPNAKVVIYTNVSTKPFYWTTADTKGLFKIASQNLPPFAYYIVAENPNGTPLFSLTTSQFISTNEEYQPQQNRNYNDYRPDPLTPGQPDISTQPDEMIANDNLPNSTNNPPVSQNPKDNEIPASADKGMNTFFMILILIIIIGLAGYLFYKKHQSAKNYPEENSKI